jgi:hypothetical protein
MEVRGQLHAPAALSPVENPPYLLYRRLGEYESRPGRYGEDKNSCPYRESNRRPDGSLVAIVTELDTNPERQQFVIIIDMFSPVPEREVMIKNLMIFFHKY